MSFPLEDTSIKKIVRVLPILTIGLCESSFHSALLWFQSVTLYLNPLSVTYLNNPLSFITLLHVIPKIATTSSLHSSNTMRTWVLSTLVDDHFMRLDNFPNSGHWWLHHSWLDQLEYNLSFMLQVEDLLSRIFLEDELFLSHHFYIVHLLQ